ncbi:MAG: hypothetical protein V1933_04760 [Candidatus Omnitrophota bacterium]
MTYETACRYNQDKIKYEMVFVRDGVPANKLYELKEFIEEEQ